MKVQHGVFGGLSIVLLLAFFLPWATISAFFASLSLSGASFPVQTQAALAYLLYLGPLLSVYLGFRAFSGRPGPWSLRRLALTTAAVNLVFALLFGLFAVSGFTLAGGYWLNLMAILALGVCAFVLPQEAGTSRPLLSAEQGAALKRRGRGMMTAAQTWAEQKRREAEQAAEEARIQRAVGRPLTRDVLDTGDAVVATRGSVVTHALIADARQRGVLDLLLASIDLGVQAGATPLQTASADPSGAHRT